MSTRELLYMQCDRCPRALEARFVDPALLMVEGDGTDAALFYSHTEAIRAAEAAGWRCQSESIGGDVCAACVEKEVGDE